ncbi:hypothetical protein BV898_19606 [Hypsibius exemplaris]|uniref:non-specific serine/threonine protein kinase n=1 Tax=Hypsibius exemplaris TaxID=2072580 RepID=A0A9X6RP97_HYPEX|nr:hypothetical protein BV898_19606 [Hypsibius exemplaris]
MAHVRQRADFAPQIRLQAPPHNCSFYLEANASRQSAVSLLDVCQEVQLDENQIITYTLQLLDALIYLHNQDPSAQKKYVRKAPSTANTMMPYLSYRMAPDDEERILPFEWDSVIGISGFGFVYSIKTEQSDTKNGGINCGVLVYAFGTQDEDQGFSTGIGRASDIWSVGCTVLKMVGRGQFQYKTAGGGTMSVDSNKPNRFLRQVKCGAYPDRSDAEARLGSGLCHVLAECLRKNAEQLNLLNLLLV